MNNKHGQAKRSTPKRAGMAQRTNIKAGNSLSDFWNHLNLKGLVPGAGSSTSSGTSSSI